ncbi:MAG: hypothetical protein KAV83_12260, partial [Desulfobacterales bacterium]|nr:hypothetical protein [Desulfobacterales bacterium]
TGQIKLFQEKRVLHPKTVTFHNTDFFIPNFASFSNCHCEERSDVAISSPGDCFAIARNDTPGTDFQITLAKFGLNLVQWPLPIEGFRSIQVKRCTLCSMLHAKKHGGFITRHV